MSRFRFWALLVFGPLLLGYLLSVLPRILRPGDRMDAVIPHIFLADLPVNCRQVVLVLAAQSTSIDARLWRMERRGSRWEPLGDSIPVSLGGSGLAWGRGEHKALPPAGFPSKEEGDRCSPAGVFRIPFAFGYGGKEEAAFLRLPYRPVTPTLSGVDDVRSRYYNQIVDASSVTPDWQGSETMLREDGLYRWGAFIDHNPERVPGAGSCIFFHLWRGPGEGTAGCTAMAEEDVIQLLAWLDPAAEPRLVQGLEGW